MISLPDYLPFSALDSLVPIPMFHVEGATYAPSMVGCRLPGHKCKKML